MGQSSDRNVLGKRSSCAKALGYRRAWLMTEPEAISVAHGVTDRASTERRKLEGLGRAGFEEPWSPS